MSIQVSGSRTTTSWGAPSSMSPCSIATLPSELLAPESTAVHTFTQKVTVTLNYGQLLYLENALLVAKP